MMPSPTLEKPYGIADSNLMPRNGNGGLAPSCMAPLREAWQRALGADAETLAHWRSEGGKWAWHPDGVSVVGGGDEWSNLVWQQPAASAWKSLTNFVIELTVRGKGEAAGLSFGHYRDFLAPLDDSANEHRLQLEIDSTAGRWAFRVNGRLQGRSWWNGGVAGTEDLLQGQFGLKARRAADVRFSDITVRGFQSSCQLSVVITCFRFLQRLRVTLRNWCEQTLPAGAFEILVVNPQSPDGTQEHLAAVALGYPHVRVRELAVEPKLATNKSAMINRAVQASRGEWIWLTDADCLFSPGCAAQTLAQIHGRPARLFFGQRRYLSASQTGELLAGRLDGCRDFEALSRNASPRSAENSPWGYTQIVHRSTLERTPYREAINHFAHSDSLFIQDCQSRGIPPEQIQDLFCLHLDHPFAWYGTKVFL